MNKWAVLGNLDSPFVAALQKVASLRDIEKSDYIVSQGEPATHVHLVLAGCARAYRDCPSGNRVRIAEFLPGAFFGEAAIYHSLEADNIIALEEGVLASFSADSFREILSNHPEFHLSFSQSLFERWQDTAQRLYELSALSTPMRVNAELLRMLEPPEINEVRRVIRPAPVLSELAERISATRESVSRAINNLVREEKILREPGALIIRSEEFLEEEV